MANLQSQLIVRLIDGVSRPAAAAGKALRGIGQAARAANGTSLAGVQRRLAAGISANNRRLEAMRGRMLDAVAAAWVLRRALGAPLTAAIDFETMLADISQKANLSKDAAKQLGASIKQLARDTNMASSQMGKSIDFLIGMGLGGKTDAANVAAATGLAPIVGKAATAYRAASEDMARTAHALFLNLKTPVADMTKAFDALGQAAQEGGFEFKDMAAYLPALTAMAQNLGIKGADGAADLGAALQIVRRGAGDASEAATNLSNVFQKMYAPLTAKKFKEFGIDIRKEVDKGLAAGKSPIQTFIEQTQIAMKKGARAPDLFQDRQVQLGMLALLQGYDDYIAIREKAKEANGRVEQDFQSRIETSLGAVERFKSAMENLQVAVGTALLNNLTGVLDKIVAIANAASDFATKFPELTTAVASAVTAMVGLRLAGLGIGWLGLGASGAVLGLADALGKFVEGAKAIGGAALVPFFASFRRIAGVTQIAKMRFGMMRRAFREGATGMAGVVQGSFATIARAMWGLMLPTGILTGMMRALKFAVIGTGIGAALVGLAMAGTWIYNNWKGLGELFSGIVDGFKEATGPALDAIQPIIDIVKKLWNGISDLVGPIKATAEEWRAWGRAIGQTIGNVVRGIIELPGKIIAAFQALAGQMFEIGRQIVQNLWDGMTSLFDSLISWVQGKANAIANALRIGGGPVGGGLAVGNAGAPTPGIASKTGAAIGSALGGPAPAARAGGGPVNRGRRYIVGERRPELFVPGQSGRILLNVPGGGSAPINVHAAITINGITDPERILRKLEHRMERIGLALRRGIQADVGLGVT